MTPTDAAILAESVSVARRRSVRECDSESERSGHSTVLY